LYFTPDDWSVMGTLHIEIPNLDPSPTFHVLRICLASASSAFFSSSCSDIKPQLSRISNNHNSNPHNQVFHPPHTVAMPRQSRPTRSAAPSRPTVAPRAPAPQQQRPATTMAAPPQQHAAPPAAAAAPSAGPGLFGQMASTAAGVAVGSSIGHAIGGFFGGGSSAPAEASPQAVQAQAAPQQSSYSGNNNCQGATQNFTQCMDEHNGNMQVCNWYLEQLKACQAAAAQYTQ
jgi:hypothetical protein